MKALKFKIQAAQGDMLITRIDTLPKGLKLSKSKNGTHVLAHSETGHNHIVKSRSADLLIDETNNFIAYLQVNEPCTVEHLRSFDTHKPIALDKGVYEIRRQREYTPQGFRMAQD